MKIKRFVLGMYQENCYLVWHDQTKKGFLVDPGTYSEAIMDFIKENNIELECIVLTHAHGDHIGGLERFMSEFNAPVYIHEKEAPILKDANKNESLGIVGYKIEIDADRLLKDGEELEIGGIPIKILHTPGHTPGGMCIYVGSYLISGDTLFAESIGRTDFRYSSTDDLINAVKNKLYLLPDDTIVLPGHGLETSIGHEKKRNPFVRP
ncbi:MAG: MBL fold metallo-hydrolase [Clostridia bacterium]|nr:MBL fold metallo-hydrolase [Clostridia bacterium]